MIKKTLYFGNPCSLSKINSQLKICREESQDVTIPIEDIGVMILDHMQIRLSHALLMALMDNNVAVISCNGRHLPEGLMLPMTGHHAFTEKVNVQVNISEPLRKNLWQQTVIAKIKNQATHLNLYNLNHEPLLYFAGKVKSGDAENMEGRAAHVYWQTLFSHLKEFKRGRYEEPPNNLLNYGYAILRAVIARSLVGSGLMTFMGIHHRNKYNPYVLADDIMEPFRPFVDQVVLEIMEVEEEIDELTPALKKRLLVIPAMDVGIDGMSSPLMVAAKRTTASLLRCMEGEDRKVIYPVFLNRKSN